MARPSLITIARLVAFLLTLIAIDGASPASAHPELERTVPAADALLAAATVPTAAESDAAWAAARQLLREVNTQIGEQVRAITLRNR